MTTFIPLVSEAEVNLAPGYCQCGCGKKTNLADGTDASKGWVKGRPLRYILGHSPKTRTYYRVEDRGHHTPCWIWAGTLTAKGYAKRAGVRLHRAMYERKRGPIPPGLEPDHLCKVKACINPDHIEAVTHTVNVRRQDRTILTFEKAETIRELLRQGRTPASIAREFGLHRASVYHIRNGTQWV